MLRSAMTLVLWVAGLYVAIGAALFLFQRSLIYHPGGPTVPPAAVGLNSVEQVSVPTDDGLELLGWWSPPDAGKPTVLYLHGNAGTLADRVGKIRPFIDLGYGVFLLAWRGYSGNPGSPSEAGLMADGRAGVAFLSARGIALEDLVYYGESLGTGVVARLAIDQPPAALVLEAPYDSITGVAQDRYRIYPARLMVRDRFDTLSIIEDVRAPIMVIHGRRDAVIPLKHAERLVAPLGDRVRFEVYEQAGHTDLFDFGAFQDVIDFIAKSHRQPAG